MINRWRRRWSSPTRTAIMADRNTTIDIDVPGMALASVRAMSAPRGTQDAPSRDRGHQQRDQEIVAGQRQAEEAPLHFVAADYPHGVETLQQIAGAAEISNGAGAIGRPLPKTPFDAGVIGPQPGTGEAGSGENGEAGIKHRARRASRRGKRRQDAERHRQVIGVALLEAERTGTDV